MNKPRGILGLSNNQTYAEVAMKEYTMTQFLNSENIRNEIARRWLEIGRETTGKNRWARLETEYPNVNLPAIRQLAQKKINGEDESAFAVICHRFQLSLGHLSSAEIHKQRYEQYRNGDMPTDEEDKFVFMGPLEFALRILDPDTLKTGDVFGLPVSLLFGRVVKCGTPKSIIDPFRRRDGAIWEAGWRFEFLSSDYLNYQIKVIAKPSSASEKQKRAAEEAEKKRELTVLLGELDVIEQMKAEVQKRLDALK